MSLLGVSIDFTCSNFPKTSTSGLKVCDHFVLTHCSLIWNFLKENLSKLNQINIEKKHLDYIQKEFSHCINSIASNSRFRVTLPTQSSPDIQSKNGNKKYGRNVFPFHTHNAPTSAEAFIHHIFISPLHAMDFYQLFANEDCWKFDKNNEKQIIDKYLEIIYLSTFVILKIKDGCSIDSCLSEFESLASHPQKGATLFIDGCPFGEGGNSIFLNSISKGIISNISEGETVLLTDARCILGCEGAPTYSLDPRFGVCGIVVSPFCWLKGEWVGLTFVAVMKPLIEFIRLLQNPLNQLSLDQGLRGARISTLKDEVPLKGCPQGLKALSVMPEMDIIEANIIRDAVSLVEKCIVRIICPSTKEWGTGVIVRADKGFVISCAHVTKSAKNKVVDVILWTGERVQGIVIFETNPSATDLEDAASGGEFNKCDVSFISLARQPMFSLPLGKELPLVGTPVLVGGHPLFNEDALPAPSFVLGNLAKVSKVKAPWKSPPTELSCRGNEDSFIRPTEVNLNSSLVCLTWNQFGLRDEVIPLTIQTTCAVYNGVSGAPVVALHPVKGATVIGIVSCCARDAEEKVNFPHVNLATCSFLLAEAVERFNLTNDSFAFELLNWRSATDRHYWKSMEEKLSKL